MQWALLACGGAAVIRNALCVNPDHIMVHLHLVQESVQLHTGQSCVCLPSCAIVTFEIFLGGQVQTYGIGCMLCMPTELGQRFAQGPSQMIYQACISLSRHPSRCIILVWTRIQA